MLAAVDPDLPFQPMLQNIPLQVVRLEGLFDMSSLEAHRHDFYMLCWVTEGFGVHRIGYREFDWLPGRVFFLQRNQVHQVMQYPQNGWMILFSELLYREFVERNPWYDGFGLFNFFNPDPYVDLDEAMLKRFNTIAESLMQDVEAENLLPVMQHYLSVLLLYAGQYYRERNGLSCGLVESRLLIKLKELINCHYPVHREPAFYGEKLGVSARRLNEICRSATGKGVYELVIDRLLTECEWLLAGRAKPVKAICFEMGFTDPANFTTFFKKHRGMSPVEFRMKLSRGR